MIGRSDSVPPAVVMLRAVQDGMHVERLAYYGKEDPIRKTIGENSTDLPLRTNHPEQVWIARGSFCRNENFVDQIFTEIG